MDKEKTLFIVRLLVGKTPIDRNVTVGADTVRAAKLKRWKAGSRGPHVFQVKAVGGGGGWGGRARRARGLGGDKVDSNIRGAEVGIVGGNTRSIQDQKEGDNKKRR